MVLQKGCLLLLLLLLHTPSVYCNSEIVFSTNADPYRTVGELYLNYSQLGYVTEVNEIVFSTVIPDGDMRVATNGLIGENVETISTHLTTLVAASRIHLKFFSSTPGVKPFRVIVYEDRSSREYTVSVNWQYKSPEVLSQRERSVVIEVGGALRIPAAEWFANPYPDELLYEVKTEKGVVPWMALQRESIETPVEVGLLAIEGVKKGVQVSGNMMLIIFEDKVVVYDASDPSAMFVVEVFALQNVNIIHGAALTPNHLYIAVGETLYAYEYDLQGDPYLRDMNQSYAISALHVSPTKSEVVVLTAEGFVFVSPEYISEVIPIPYRIIASAVDADRLHLCVLTESPAQRLIGYDIRRSSSSPKTPLFSYALEKEYSHLAVSNHLAVLVLNSTLQLFNVTSGRLLGRYIGKDRFVAVTIVAGLVYAVSSAGVVVVSVKDTVVLGGVVPEGVEEVVIEARTKFNTTATLRMEVLRGPSQARTEGPIPETSGGVDMIVMLSIAVNSVLCIVGVVMFLYWQKGRSAEERVDHILSTQTTEREATCDHAANSLLDVELDETIALDTLPA